MEFKHQIMSEIRNLSKLKFQNQISNLQRCTHEMNLKDFNILKFQRKSHQSARKGMILMIESRSLYSNLIALIFHFLSRICTTNTINTCWLAPYSVSKKDELTELLDYNNKKSKVAMSWNQLSLPWILKKTNLNTRYL